MLRILEAMGVLALLTRETPAAIAAERKELRSILESSASQARGVEKRMEAYTTRLESRLTQLPKELETGLDPPRIAKLLSESLRQCFQQSGMPDTAKALGRSCSEMNSIQKQLLKVDFDRREAKVGEALACRVEAERIGFAGYGMMMAEIGLPPGVAVGRESPEETKQNDVDGYEVQPNRAVFYFWPSAR